jgi:cytochrome c oxidase subunit 2
MSERLWAGSMTAITLLLVGVVVATSAQVFIRRRTWNDRFDVSAPGRRVLGFRHRDRAGWFGGRAWWRSLAAFVPSCIISPGKPITIRLASADVVHGFLVQGTNVNAMVVPGYVTTVRTTFKDSGERLMPCHEFCGVGHQAMWARVRVVEPSSFPSDSSNKQKAVNCAS